VDLGLTDSVIIVTGGSSGIGLATVELLLAEGACVATCGRDVDRLALSLAAAGGRYGDRLLAMTADVTNADDVADLVGSAVERWGRVDGLVNNAGQSRMSTFATTSDDDWRAEFELKFFGLLHAVRAAEPHLRSSESGAIVNIGAVLARQPEGRLVATSAARAGVLNLSKSLATDLAPDIRVNSVLLGLVDTGQWKRRYELADGESASGQTYDEWCAELAADRGVVLGRLGTASEVAPTVALLLSPMSGYTTGTTIEIAGGVSRSV
jgi:NAD(P)-dependent dehydrogenase (short-subunit alcohol dehydrogenase family)